MSKKSIITISAAGFAAGALIAYKLGLLGDDVDEAEFLILEEDEE